MCKNKTKQKNYIILSNVISNPFLHQFFFAHKKQNPLQNIYFRGIHQEGNILIRWNAVLFLLHLMTPLGFNILLLTKPLSKLSSRRWKEVDKEEEGQRMNEIKSSVLIKLCMLPWERHLWRQHGAAVGGKRNVSPKPSQDERKPKKFQVENCSRSKVKLGFPSDFVPSGAMCSCESLLIDSSRG